MKRKRVYTDAPPDIEKSLDRAVTVKDFLPPPSELILAAYPQNSSAVKKLLSSIYKKKGKEYA